MADELDLPQHVLRFWESRFREIKPMKRGGGRRYYRPDDVDLLRGIKHLLYGEGYTIRGVQRILREEGSKFVEAVWREGASQPPHGSTDDDFIEEAASAKAVETKPGLFRRLIGRDLDDREDDAAERTEPALKSVAVPQADPIERAGPAEEAAPPPPRPVATPVLVATGALRRDDIGRLHAALHELTECRKLLDAALAVAA
ncbi:MAG: MerR family transcriptional regulator [Pseudolabrys sp.]